MLVSECCMRQVASLYKTSVRACQRRSSSTFSQSVYAGPYMQERACVGSVNQHNGRRSRSLMSPLRCEEQQFLKGSDHGAYMR